MLRFHRLTFQLYPFDETGIREYHKRNQRLFESKIGSEYPVCPGHCLVILTLLGSPPAWYLLDDVHSIDKLNSQTV